MIVHAELVRRLSPGDTLVVMRHLGELRKEFLGARSREYIERQETTKETRRQLQGLQRSLEKLSLRGQQVLQRSLATSFELDGPYSTTDRRGNLIDGESLLWILRKALGRVADDLEPNRRGSPGKLSDASRCTIRQLVDLYCTTHNAPRPSYDFFAEEVRNPESLDFALDCLRAWGDADALELTAQDLGRSR